MSGSGAGKEVLLYGAYVTAAAVSSSYADDAALSLA